MKSLSLYTKAFNTLAEEHKLLMELVGGYKNVNEEDRDTLHREFLNSMIGMAKIYDLAFSMHDALLPFTKLLQDHNKHLPDERPVFAINDSMITMLDLRRALLAVTRFSEISKLVNEGETNG